MKIFILILLSFNLYAFPVEIVENLPQRQAAIEGHLTLNNLIQGIATADSITKQIEYLKALKDLQKNPSSAIVTVNNAVTKLINKFNELSDERSKKVNNLSELINAVTTSTSSEAMHIKLVSASNLQLSQIRSTLEQVQMQQQAIINYKRAEVIEEQENKKKANSYRKSVVEGFNKF